MKTVILDMQSELYGAAICRLISQELSDVSVVVSLSPEETIDKSKALKPMTVLMDITDYSPRRPDDREEQIRRLRTVCPDCKAVFIVDDYASEKIVNGVKHAKQKGTIESFVFTSATDNYLVAVLDSI